MESKEYYVKRNRFSVNFKEAAGIFAGKFSHGKTSAARIWELDFLRGIAIILMVLFHLIVDLNDFFGVPIDYFSGFWYYEGKVSAVLFILLAGISSTLSRNNFKRGCIILAIGMGISLISWIIFPDEYIRFGILHLLGSCMVLYSFIPGHAFLSDLAAGVIFILIGNRFSAMTVKVSYLIPLGLVYNNFVSMDYYPLFPWSGVFLIGVAVGKLLYSKQVSLFSNTAFSKAAHGASGFSIGAISFLGRHSLLIYLIHQPLLLLILFILSFIF